MAGGDGARIRCFSRTPCADGTRKSARFIQAAVLSAGGRGTGPGRPFDAERLFPQMKAIADTGLLVAFANRRDRYHEWALQIANQVTEPLLTCEAVLAETAFHLGSAALALAFVRDGLVRPAFGALRRQATRSRRPVPDPVERTASPAPGDHNRLRGLSCLSKRAQRSDSSDPAAGIGC